MPKSIRSIIYLVILLALIACLAAAGFFWLNAANASQASSTAATSSAKAINIPLDAGRTVFSSILLSHQFISTSTQSVLTFALDPESVKKQPRNPTLDVLINGKQAGKITARTVGQVGFSPDGSYFAFKVDVSFGATSGASYVAVINFRNKTVKMIPSPLKMSGAPRQTTPVYTVNTYIDSYSWSGNSIDVETFFIGNVGTGRVYRISPKEIWNYNLTTGKYTFVKDLPETAKSIPSSAVTKPVKVPVSMSEYIRGYTSFQQASSTTDAKTGTNISFSKIIGDMAQNPSYSVLVNGKKVGEDSGMAISLGSFSPNGKYFVYRTRSMCGAGCNAHDGLIIDIPGKSLASLRLPIHSEVVKLQSENTPLPSNATSSSGTIPYNNVDSFISSFAWNADNTLNITMYIVATSIVNHESVAYYRISPKEVWQYNPVTGKYTFVKDLPETAMNAKQGKLVSLAPYLTTYRVQSYTNYITRPATVRLPTYLYHAGSANIAITFGFNGDDQYGHLHFKASVSTSTAKNSVSFANFTATDSPRPEAVYTYGKDVIIAWQSFNRFGVSDTPHKEGFIVYNTASGKVTSRSFQQNDGPAPKPLSDFLSFSITGGSLYAIATTTSGVVSYLIN